MGSRKETNRIWSNPNDFEGKREAANPRNQPCLSTCRPHGYKSRDNGKFSSAEEEAFVGILQGWSLQNRPLSKELFLKHVKPTNWCSGFMQCHKSILSSQVVQALKEERTELILLKSGLKLLNKNSFKMVFQGKF